MSNLKKVKHIGTRPTSPTKEVQVDGRFMHFEKATGKYWTMREINSGCNEIVNHQTGIEDLLFCSECDEWFSAKQFKDV